MERYHGDTCNDAYCGGGSGAPEGESQSSSSPTSGKAKMMMWEEDGQDPSGGGGGGMDELLTALGYKVRSSDMADVAQKLEQLEMVMGTAQEDGVSHIAYDTVPYNPSDLSSWLQSMFSELNPPPPPEADPVLAPAGSSSTIARLHRSRTGSQSQAQSQEQSISDQPVTSSVESSISLGADLCPRFC
ncbi:uncharacterized protein J3R85_017172 [Psidium guajava]|nr:uncharacterized protein J3R85_017172 [Psidium guajava]